MTIYIGMDILFAMEICISISISAEIFLLTPVRTSVFTVTIQFQADSLYYRSDQMFLVLAIQSTPTKDRKEKIDFQELIFAVVNWPNSELYGAFVCIICYIG